MAINDFTRWEYGAPHELPTPTTPEGQPRGDAMMPVPVPVQFAGTTGWTGRAFWMQHDEALQHSRANAWRMRLDPVIDACMRLRTYPTSLLSFHIDPDDDEDPYQVECATKAQKILKRMPGFHFARHSLLDDGTFTGRCGIKIRWEKQFKQNRLWEVPTKFEHVSGDKLVFFWNGDVGIAVQGSFTGQTRPIPGYPGRAYVFNREEREQLICYQFEPTDAHFDRPTKAGSIAGLGLRDKLYWVWALKDRVWSMSMDFLEWFARGLSIFYFRNGNAEHYNQVKQWVESQWGNSVMLMPDILANENQNKKVFEHIQPTNANPQFLMTLITDYFDRLFKEIILGQTLTSGTAPTGLGSGVATAHQTTFDNIVKYDAIGTDEVISRDLLGPFYRANFPGCPRGHYVSEVDDPNVQQMIDNAHEIFDMGGAVPEQPLLEVAGLPAVKPGDTILTNVQPMQPMAANQPPEGVPTLEGRPAGGQVKMSLRQWATMAQLARNGNRRASQFLRTQRCQIRGLTC